MEEVDRKLKELIAVLPSGTRFALLLAAQGEDEGTNVMTFSNMSRERVELLCRKVGSPEEAPEKLSIQ